MKPEPLDRVLVWFNNGIYVVLEVGEFAILAMSETTGKTLPISFNSIREILK